MPHRDCKITLSSCDITTFKRLYVIELTNEQIFKCILSPMQKYSVFHILICIFGEHGFYSEGLELTFWKQRKENATFIILHDKFKLIHLISLMSYMMYKCILYLRACLCVCACECVHVRLCISGGNL